MPLLLWIPYLLVATIVIGAGSAAVYTALAPKPDAVTQQNQAALPAGSTPAPVTTGVPASPQAPAPKQAAKPSFDVVRIERDGNGVIAGRAEPGWKVTIASGADELAHATADQNGEWAVVLDAPLPSGEHSIGLRARAPEGHRGVISDQSVAVSIAPQQSGRAIVALSQPGSATRLLTPAEPKPPAREKTAADKPAGAEKFQTANAGESASAPKREAATRPAAIEANKPVPATEPEVVVSFDAVDYELNDRGKGTLFLSGQAEAGARVTLYLDNSLVGEAVAAGDGTWTFESLRTLPPDKRHTMRADARQTDGQVASRAEVTFTPPAVPKPVAPAAPAEMPKDKKKDTTQPVVADSGSNAARKVKAPPATPAAITPKPGAVTTMRAEPAPAPAKEPARRDTVVAAAPESAPAPAKEPARRDTVVAATPESATAPATSQPAERQAPVTTPAPTRRASQAKQPVPVVRAPEPAPATPEPVKQQPQAVASAAAEPAPKPGPVKVDMLQQKRSIVVRRGDTLWHIARRRYGRGIRYTAIYRNNRNQIRNPHLIYPGQEFQLPTR